MNSTDNILPVYKSPGPTSFDVVRRIRKVTGIRRVGHAGTLDPFAEGLLLIMTGSRTKDSERLMALTKEYVAELELGVATDTYDLTGRILHRKPVPRLSEVELKKVIGRFVGEIDQLPPMFSAKKLRGKKLYEYARKGLTVRRKVNRVTVHEIELLTWEDPILTLKVCCSKGTYVRTLAHDIGERLGCGAHVRKLVRTRIGEYSAESALRLRDIEKQWMSFES